MGLIGLTWQRSGKPLAFYDYYIAAALGWFVIQAVYESIYLTATLGATGERTDAACRDLASAAPRSANPRICPADDSGRQPANLSSLLFTCTRQIRRLSLALLPVLNLAVIGEAAGLVLMRLASPIWAALWYASAVVLTIAVAALVIDWRLWGQAEDEDRSLKFLRIAYVWLFVSLAMLVLLPLHQTVVLRHLAPDSAAAQMGFSHAYYGATRHAITVGFVSLMIVGVAAKVVPTLNGVNTQDLSPLWGPFVLINAGCLLRVTGQTLTDFTPLAFPVAGVSGAVGGDRTGAVGRASGAGHVRPCSYPAWGARGKVRWHCGLFVSATRLVLCWPNILNYSACFLPPASRRSRAPMPAEHCTVVSPERACRQTGIDAEQFVANSTRSGGHPRRSNCH